jgi:hypothetical protein
MPIVPIILQLRLPITEPDPHLEAEACTDMYLQALRFQMQALLASCLDVWRLRQTSIVFLSTAWQCVSHKCHIFNSCQLVWSGLQPRKRPFPRLPEVMGQKGRTGRDAVIRILIRVASYPLSFNSFAMCVP